MKDQKQNNGGTMTRQIESGVATWNPWSELAELRRRTDDLFGQSFGYTPLARLVPTELQEAEPEVDIHETDAALQVLASLPGYTIEQIDVQATDQSFTIQGERKALFDEDKSQTHRSAGVSGSNRFFFSYTLPVDIDPKRIKATFANGVLQLELPKTEQARAKSVKVNIKAV
jgi:HSP20 family protein